MAHTACFNRQPIRHIQVLRSSLAAGMNTCTGLGPVSSSLVARPNTPFSQKGTSQVIFPHQRLDGARSATVDARGPAGPGAALPGRDWCWRCCQAAALTVVGGWPGEEQ